MTFLSVAQSVLQVAQAALPAVTRTYLAGGPGVAKVCTQLVVYPSASSTQAAGPAGINQPSISGNCAVVAVPQVTVAYSKDCYPLAEDGRPPRLPDPADVTAWTQAYLSDCWALYDALLEAKYTGALGEPCDVVTVGQALHSGPTGGVCTMQVPVTVGP